VTTPEHNHAATPPDQPSTEADTPLSAAAASPTPPDRSDGSESPDRSVGSDSDVVESAGPSGRLDGSLSPDRSVGPGGVDDESAVIAAADSQPSDRSVVSEETTPDSDPPDRSVGSPAAAAEPAAEPEPTAEHEPTGEAAAEEEPEAVLVSSSLPDLTEDEALHAALEALLLVVDSPAEVELLADALDEPVKRIREALKTMAAGYAEQSRGIDLREVGGGWRFYTRDKYAPFVEKLLLDGQRAKLTRAALESLAVIAYRQPVTRARVAAVRGVNVDGVIRTLLARGLIEETGTDKDTGGILYRTTELFLERLGLSSLEDLPPIAPLLPEVDAIDDV
jgi:segregation and condensation protein B